MATKTNLRKTVLIDSVDDIFRISFAEAIQLMQEWGINPEGIKGKNDATQRLAHHWNGLQGNVPKANRVEDRNGFRRSLEENEANRKLLYQHYQKVSNYANSLPLQFKGGLKNAFKPFDDLFNEKLNGLKSSECTILVAGESSSGKSSLINLLLGAQVLPTTDLACTMVICELRTSTGAKKAVLHFRSQGNKAKRQQPKVLDLGREDGLAMLEGYIREVDRNTDDSPYDKIEIFWPLPMLQEGMVIVDTPGIGESKRMLKFVQRYQQSSFGFIYVINSAQAGGIQKGRLQEFLRQLVNSSSDEFSPSLALFVCNKWDVVDDKNKEEVKSFTLRKLNSLYPGIKSSQVLYMSVREAIRRTEYGATNLEFNELMEGIHRLLPNCLQNSLEISYRWLSSVIKRSQYSLKVGKLMEAKNMEDKKTEFDQLQKQISHLERNAQQCVEDLKYGVNREVDKVYELVQDLLQSKEFTSRISIWESDECPKKDNWKRVTKDATERIAGRIALEVNVWERRINVIASVKEKVIMKFKRDFQLMEDQMRDIEGVLLQGDTRIITDLQKSIRREAPVGALFKRAVAADENYKGLGGAICSVGNFGSSNKNAKPLFNNYDRKNSTTKMHEATKLYTSSIFQSKLLKEQIFKYFKKLVKGIDDIAKMIPDFLKADREIMESLAEDLGSSRGKLREVFPQLLPECTKLMGELDMFYVRNIMKYDYTHKDLDKGEVLGSGSFATVYLAEMKNEDLQKQPVAVKEFTEVIRESNVTDILLESRIMRELDHENVVKFHGVADMQSRKGPKAAIRWALIMEVCNGSLQSVFLNPETKTPGQVGPSIYSIQVETMKFVAEYGRQICRGVAYLHKKDLVHRDLKLENVLVTGPKNMTAKLSDVGLTKAQRDIAASMVGSPVYMAPELFEQHDIYDRKVDIYSLSIMIWEMWYGQDAAKHIEPQLFGSLEKAINDGLRPSLSMKHIPPEPWVNLLKAGWNLNPRYRPEASKIEEFFENVLKQ